MSDWLVVTLIIGCLVLGIGGTIYYQDKHIFMGGALSANAIAIAWILFWRRP